MKLVLISLNAHPGIGLVYDGNETIYYTDLKQVWTLNIYTGAREVAVPNVHTHELHLDKGNNLYGEHYWYVEAEEKFKNYIWRFDKNESFQIIRAEQYGENDDFSFVRDSSFVGIEIKQINGSYMVIRKDSINESVLCSAQLNHPTWSYLTAEG